jgi:hypothetical protein
VLKKTFIGLTIVAFSVVMLACQQTQEANLNANANQPTIATAPDNSEITTTTDSSGTRTDTRVFRDNPRVSKVVVTTSSGRRTVKVYSKTGEERDLRDETVDALNATGDALASGAGFVADKTEDAYDKTKEGAQTVADKTTDTAKTVANKTKEGAKEAADKAEDVADKTKAGAKKTGKTIKKIVTP